MTITLTREDAQQVTDRELIAQAIVALEYRTYQTRPIPNTNLAIEALRARLAQPEPEPVAWTDAPERIYLQVCDELDCEVPFSDHVEVSWCQDKINDSDIEYIRADTAPPQREWQGLTDEEVTACWSDGFNVCEQKTVADLRDFIARAIEAKLKGKNT